MPPHRCLWARPAVSHAGNKQVEHFPSKTDATWMPSARFRICNGAYNTFFDLVLANGIEPDGDSLALMQTCQQGYLETCRLWTFCFDELRTLKAFTLMARDLPAHHVQMILYAHYKLYCDDNTDLVREAINLSWEQELREVDTMCRTIPNLGTLLLSIQSRPRFTMLENEVAVMKSLKSVTAVPQLHAEVLPWRTGIEVKQYHEAELTVCAGSSASLPSSTADPGATIKQRTLCQDFMVWLSSLGTLGWARDPK